MERPFGDHVFLKLLYLASKLLAQIWLRNLANTRERAWIFVVERNHPVDTFQ